MGFAYVKVKIYNPAELTRSEEAELLVDSGALFSSVPRRMLERLGLKPISRQKLKVYGGRLVERDLGGAAIEYGGRMAVVPVVFGEPGDTPVLGAISLEALGYKLNPVTKELEPVELLMLTFKAL